MINRKAIGYITTNYSSSYGSVLLKDRPIASVPFLGRYRLIDFPLSNMMNAGIKTVGVVMPGNYRSLIDHVGSGKDWGLDRKKGGLFMVPGNAYGTTKGGMRFLLRDIISNKTLFQRSDKPYVVMMGTNIIFNMDLNTIIDAHENSGQNGIENSIGSLVQCSTVLRNLAHTVHQRAASGGSRIDTIRVGFHAVPELLQFVQRFFNILQILPHGCGISMRISDHGVQLLFVI